MSNTQNRIRSGTGKAIETLYNLDIYLSRSYFGDGGVSDRKIHRVRKQLAQAMNAIGGKKIFPLLKGIL